MKLHNKLIAVCIGMSFLPSCYDLDLSPHQDVSQQVFWKNETQVKQGVMGVYDCMKRTGDDTPNVAYFGNYFLLDALSDIAIAKPLAALENGTSTDRTNAYLEKWKDMYDGVTKANHALQNIGSADMPEEDKDRYLAEVRFLRGLYYFHLLDFYGGVPIYDESWNLAETYDKMLEPRSSVEEVRSFILADLDFAVRHLPYSWDAADYGRATKTAAIALRGKVYLYAQEWTKAKADFEELVHNNSTYGCSLNSDYASMFKPDTDVNPEMIFFISNSGGAGDANDGMKMAFYHGNRSTYASGWATSSLDPDFVDTYEMKDGKVFNWNDYIPGYKKMTPAERLKVLSCKQKNGKVTAYPAARKKIMEAYSDRDPRLNQTCITPYDSILGWNANKERMMEYVIFETAGPKATNGYVEQAVSRWYYFRKFVPEGDWNGRITDRNHTPVNFPLIRYADVLLMLAECYNELGETDLAVKYINEVRARPSTHMPGLNSGPAWLEARTKDQIKERLMHERGVEFAGEGIRYSDIRRWRVAEKLCNRTKKEIHGNKRQVTKFKERDYLWPIPGTEIEMNNKLTQNAGW